MPEIPNKLKQIPLKNSLLLTLRQILDLETGCSALIALYSQDTQYGKERIERLKKLSKYLQEFRSGKSWWKTEFPPEIEEILNSRKH